MDKGLSGLLLALLAPVFVGAIVAIGLGHLLSSRDRGPWLYREKRISKGREFDLLKFRTLRCAALESQRDGEAHARLLENEAENLTWAGRRILKPGCVSRLRYRRGDGYLDELPQLFNVLRGDMSLVGPRPWPPSMVHGQVAAGLDYRNHVMSGWTGPVQVQKGIVEPAGYAKLDLAYVDACRSWSSLRLLRSDFRILWRTVGVLARGEGLTY